MLKLFGLLAVAGSAAASAASPTNHYHPIHRAVAKGTGEANLPLGGNLLPMGIFYTEMEVGSPPKKFAVTIDTEAVVERLLKRAEIEGRADDNEETIRERMRVYDEQTAPLLDYYVNQNILSQVDGMGSVEAVSDRIEGALSAS